MFGVRCLVFGAARCWYVPLCLCLLPLSCLEFEETSLLLPALLLPAMPPLLPPAPPMFDTVSCCETKTGMVAWNDVPNRGGQYSSSKDTTADDMDGDDMDGDDMDVDDEDVSSSDDVDRTIAPASSQRLRLATPC